MVGEGVDITMTEIVAGVVAPLDRGRGLMNVVEGLSPRVQGQMVVLAVGIGITGVEAIVINDTMMTTAANSTTKITENWRRRNSLILRERMPQ